jgi:hypothetical protein
MHAASVKVPQNSAMTETLRQPAADRFATVTVGTPWRRTIAK